jgi:hypothetical protein
MLTIVLILLILRCTSYFCVPMILVFILYVVVKYCSPEEAGVLHVSWLEQGWPPRVESRRRGHRGFWHEKWI